MILSNEIFVRKAISVHGKRYDYGNVSYSTAHEKVSIVCKRHGSFEQTPSSHTRGAGCPKCGKESMVKARASINTFDSFIRKAEKVHGNLYTYIKSSYVGLSSPVRIRCSTHGVFSCLAWHHLKGTGCASCAKRKKLDTKTFVSRAKSIHGNTYRYSCTVYVCSAKKLDVLCPKHGKFSIRPHDHLKGVGCGKCRSKSFSKKAIEWIESVAKSKRMRNVQHAMNVGEFRIPNTLLRVDGYHANTNTVFEFHGDDFHGNPVKHSPRSKPNPYSSKTAQRLYRETLKREELLRSLGYNLIVVWEYDYDRRHNV